MDQDWEIHLDRFPGRRGVFFGVLTTTHDWPFPHCLKPVIGPLQRILHHRSIRICIYPLVHIYTPSIGSSLDLSGAFSEVLYFDIKTMFKLLFVYYWKGLYERLLTSSNNYAAMNQCHGLDTLYSVEVIILDKIHTGDSNHFWIWPLHDLPSSSSCLANGAIPFPYLCQAMEADGRADGHSFWAWRVPGQHFGPNAFAVSRMVSRFQDGCNDFWGQCPDYESWLINWKFTLRFLFCV